MVEQVQLDFPCRICKRINYFVSTLSPTGSWVCTNCQSTISDRNMCKWQKIREGIIREGRVVRVGMSTIERRGVI